MESNLHDLKLKYEELKKKYNLPEFNELNRDFHIEKIAESETDFLLREIIKFIGDKIFNFMRFVEGIINPANAPLFVFSIVKTISAEERKKLSEIYKTLSRFEIDLLGIDLGDSEKKEAEFIKDFYTEWQNIKKEILGVVDVIKKNWDKKIEFNDNGKGYFG